METKTKQKPKEDFLKEDPPYANQNWALISFVAPDDMVVKKQLYYMNRFLVSDTNRELEAQAQHMAKYVNSQITLNITSTLDQLRASVNEDDRRVYDILNKKHTEMLLSEDQIVKECRRKYEIDESELLDKYKAFIVENRTAMDREFDDANNLRLSVRGFKVRGCFSTLAEADPVAKRLREYEPAMHIFVAPVGKWIPLDIEADEVQNQEHLLPQLGELMEKYYQNVQERNEVFNKRKEDMVANNKRHNAENTREKLREKLRKTRNAKMMAEVEELSKINQESREKS